MNLHDIKDESDRALFLKIIFNMCIRSKFNLSLMRSFAQILGVTDQRIKIYADMYRDKYASEKEKMIYNNMYSEYIKRVAQSKYRKYLESKKKTVLDNIVLNLMNYDNLDDAISYLKTTEISLNSCEYLTNSVNGEILKKLTKYQKNLSEDELNKQCKKIYGFLVEYRNILRKEEKTRDIDKISKIFEYLTRNKIDYKEYFTSEKSLKKLNEYYKLLKKYDNKKIVKYEKMLSEGKKEMKEKNLKESKESLYELAYCLKNGILKKDGSLKQVDVLDYYFFTDKEPLALSWLVRSCLSVGDRKLVAEYLSKVKNASYCRINISWLLQSPLTKVINGEKFNFGIDELIFIVNYLQKNNISVTEKNFEIACKNYINCNLLYKEDIDEKVNIKKF